MVGALSATAPHGITHVPVHPQSLYQLPGAIGAADDRHSSELMVAKSF
jgi:hypothetical protein